MQCELESKAGLKTRFSDGLEKQTEKYTKRQGERDWELSMAAVATKCQICI